MSQINGDPSEKNRYEVVVIGTGVSGIYQVHKLRELGVSVLALEAGSDVG